jgi:molybdate transport system ATP-binding protein
MAAGPPDIAMISARIRKSYAGGRESAPFSLDVEFTTSSGITGLFGPSGAGKTLILDSIAGFVRPDEGRIMLNDAILFDGQSGVDLRPQKRNCGYVFQNYALFPHMTLRDNLAFAAERLPRLERHRRVAEVLEKFRLTGVAGRRPHELSGGQKQRCSIARALIAAPRVLLLDEPARGLDLPLRAELYEIVRQVQNDFSVPVLLVTHSLDECFALADIMMILRDGRVVQSGPPSEIAKRPANLQIAQLLGIFNVLAVEVRALDPSRNTSVLRFGEFDLNGPYVPGHLKGDRVHVVVTPQQLTAKPRIGKLSSNEIPLALVRSVERPESVRLEFDRDIAVEIPKAEFNLNGPARDWAVHFPPDGLRVL